MCEEIILHRYDDTPWGFRLTGGHDFGIPLTVVRVNLSLKRGKLKRYIGDLIINNGLGYWRQYSRGSWYVCWRYDY